MLEEKQYSFADELPDIDHYDVYTTQGVNIDYKTMQELADCFVGFATAPQGIYNHKIFEIMSYKFNTIKEIKDAVRANHDANVEMILYYIASLKSGVQIRMVEV